MKHIDKTVRSTLCLFVVRNLEIIQIDVNIFLANSINFIPNCNNLNFEFHGNTILKKQTKLIYVIVLKVDGLYLKQN